jgi:death-on-curing protein
MILLTVDEIILIHEKLIRATGGLTGIRDVGLLQSAVYSAVQMFGAVEFYPTIEEKATNMRSSM